ncbi:MAG: HEAT repeat domain-containing protein [Blastopirellula sp. JB062]
MAADLSLLIDQLNSSDVSQRLSACEKLGGLGPDSRPAAVSLCRLTGDPDESVREAAVGALETLEAPAGEDAAALGELLALPSMDARYWAATLLGRLGDQAGSQAAALLKAISDDPEVAVRQKAVWAIDQIGLRTDTVKKTLEQAATSTDPRLARLAGKALAKF